MNIADLAPLVITAFEDGHSENTVISVKDGNSRDVVTALDERLHEVAEYFLAQNSPETLLVSEEGVAGEPFPKGASGDVLIVDPLDGSSNFALELRDFGFMACHLVDFRILSGLVVIPKENIYLIWNDGVLSCSRPMPIKEGDTSSPVYLAYPPDLSEIGAKTRDNLLEASDNESSGVYRYGSACLGLYRTLRGAHAAFVAIDVRIWDVIAFLPMLVASGVRVHYLFEHQRVSIVAARNQRLSQALLASFSPSLARPFIDFRPGDKLSWEA